jgi:hypothetical protein
MSTSTIYSCSDPLHSGCRIPVPGVLAAARPASRVFAAVGDRELAALARYDDRATRGARH